MVQDYKLVCVLDHGHVDFRIIMFQPKFSTTYPD